MNAIQTKYIGPTNTRGSRVKASTESGATLTVGGGMKAGNVYVNVTRCFDDTFTIAKGE